MLDAVYAAFLLNHHDLDGDPGIAGPFGVRGVFPVTDHVAAVSHPCVLFPNQALLLHIIMRGGMSNGEILYTEHEIR